MKVLSEKVDNLSFFAMAGVLVLLCRLFPDLALLFIFVGTPAILLVMLTQRESE